MKLTYHARQRITEMGVTEDEVADVVAHHDVSCPDPTPGRTRLFGGRLVVIVGDETGAVVTVLWRTSVTGRTGREEAS